jgi:hypothetical protein
VKPKPVAGANIGPHFLVFLGTRAYRQEQVMRHEINFIGRRRNAISRIAQVVERIGLAVAGALCGLFVAAYTLRTNAGVLGTPGMIMAMTMIGMAGFYLGVDIPRIRTRAVRVGSEPKADPVELLAASGTFLTAMAALLSVIGIIFDETPPFTVAGVIGCAWLCGAALQLGAGTMARWRNRRLPV